MSRGDDDWLDEYLRGSSEISRIYRAGAPQSPPAALDQHILAKARNPPRKSGHRMTLSFAASVLLALAAVFALTVVPRTMMRSDDGPRFLRTSLRSGDANAMRLVYPTLKAQPAAPRNLARGIIGRNSQLYSSDPTSSRGSGGDIEQSADPAAWLAAIAALRDAGQTAAADAQLRRLRSAYPNFAAADSGADAAER